MGADVELMTFVGVELIDVRWCGTNWQSPLSCGDYQESWAVDSEQSCVK